ncbi:MAG: AmmeMemoRadiSam system protein B [Myxococcota bacterium]|jgi:AmmeMemoRadiSam system protein B|nr:AmmeMemoRadiSam system protein B [Myxococcota bacterium]
MIRPSAVAGQFYPDDPSALLQELQRCSETALEPQAATGIIVPHAGYRYSGATAGKVIASTIIPKSCLLLGPNHTGRGAAKSMMGEGAWELPGGFVDIDTELGALLLALEGVRNDARAHAFEHSLEVILPFLRYRQSALRFVPLTLSRLSYEQCRRLGEGIASVCRQLGERAPLLVASSDMSHFLDAVAAERLDRMAIDAILALDPERLYQVVEAHQISMCGVIPCTVMLVAASHLGAARAELIEYTHSGVATGDTTRVVAYAGLRVS